MDPKQNTDSVIDPKAKSIAEQAFSNTMERVGHALTEEDMKNIEELDKDDKEGKKVAAYIIQRVPNFEAILSEEMVKLVNPQES